MEGGLEVEELFIPVRLRLRHEESHFPRGTAGLCEQQDEGDDLPRERLS